MPSPPLVKQILQNTQVDAAMLVPALLDALCRDPESFDLLCKLDSIQYAGAPLNAVTGKLLSPHVKIVPTIGSTDSGGYFMMLPNTREDWDYGIFHPHTGIVMEHRVDNMYELVFVRNSQCHMQPVFELNPGIDRFETKDLWVEHPIKKGQWRIVGRSDDLIKLSDGNGLLVMPLEMTIVEHPLVKNALIGGHGQSKLILLIEPINFEVSKAELIQSLDPYIERVDSQMPERTKLDKQLIVVANPSKPWPLTIKDTPIRSKVLKLYESEIENVYRTVL